MAPFEAFEAVLAIGLTLPGVEAATRYDGSPQLKIGGAFMAGMATHPSAEPATIVVRATFEDREQLLEDAPEVYYLTDYYRNHPVVLARLSALEPSALRDLLAMSRRLTLPKARSSRLRAAAPTRSRPGGI